MYKIGSRIRVNSTAWLLPVDMPGKTGIIVRLYKENSCVNHQLELELTCELYVRFDTPIQGIDEPYGLFFDEVTSADAEQLELDL